MIWNWRGRTIFYVFLYFLLWYCILVYESNNKYGQRGKLEPIRGSGSKIPLNWGPGTKPQVRVKSQAPGLRTLWGHCFWCLACISTVFCYGKKRQQVSRSNTHDQPWHFDPKSAKTSPCPTCPTFAAEALSSSGCASTTTYFIRMRYEFSAICQNDFSAISLP